ncbi:ABC transporter permease subunit [Rathayibacter sp. VKM Ac-2804]|nr:ABC transporter permease subunit [Rathayibacter sp. VKM Ac-2804]
MRSARPAGSSRLRTLAVLLPLAFIGVILIYPVGRMLITSFSTPTWGLQNYVEMASDGYSLRVIGRTFQNALVVTAVTLVIAYPFAYLMTIVSDRVRAVMVAVVLLPFWTSAVVRSFAWLVLFQANGPIDSFARSVGLGSVTILGTPLAVTIAMTQVLLPFMALPLFNTLRGIDRSLLSAARSLGAPPARAFLRVYLPLSRPGVIAGCMMVFILSLGFYITPALLGSPREQMVPQLITQLVQQNLDLPSASALAVTLLVLATLVLTIASLFGGRSTAVAGVSGGTR